MAKQLNKHTPNSEELFRRLESKDSAGLDDFEKEALEGFESLENDVLAKSLHAKLDSKIEEVYFEKKSGNRTFFYLSMAAGLVIVIGLSLIFYNFFGSQKQELALNKEVVQNEVLPEQDLPAGNSEVPVNEKAAEEEKPEPVTDKDLALKKPADADARGGSGAIVSKGKAIETTSSSNQEGEIKKTEKDAYNDPVTPTSPVLADEQKQQTATTETKNTKEESEAPAKSSTSDNNSLENTKARSTLTVGGLKKAANKEEPKRKEKSNAPGEALASDDYKAAEMAPSPAGQPISGKLDENSEYSQAYFAQKPYNKAQDYIKSEIDKNELLKNNVKEFKAKLTIDESGKITKVKFLTSFINCNDCEKQLESILLKMPNWQASAQSGKKIKETIHFVYP